MISIYSKIYTRLDNFLNETKEIDWREWLELKDDLEWCVSMGRMALLHETMLPFYAMYAEGDERIYSPKKYKALEFVEKIADQDEMFLDWIAEHDLMELTEGWISMGSTRKYMDLLERLATKEYETDWQALYDALNQKILELEVSGESQSGEFYCILHGFLMIMIGSHNDELMRERFHLLREHWRFFRHLYSIMVRRIVGMRFPNFAGVINNAKVSPDCTPYLKILYGAIMERSDDLCRLGTKQANLDKAVKAIEDVMSKTEPSTDLDELCEVLFPDEIRQMLNTHRLPSYQQLRQENDNLRHQSQDLLRQMQEQRQQTNEEIEKMTLLLKSAVEAAIPVGDIEHELMELPAQTAWGIFQSLNELLSEHETWRRYDIGIRKKLKARLAQGERTLNDLTESMKAVAERPTTTNNVYPQKGSTANIGCDQQRSEFKNYLPEGYV